MALPAPRFSRREAKKAVHETQRHVAPEVREEPRCGGTEALEGGADLVLQARVLGRDVLPFAGTARGLASGRLDSVRARQ